MGYGVMVGESGGKGLALGVTEVGEDWIAETELPIDVVVALGVANEVDQSWRHCDNEMIAREWGVEGRKGRVYERSMLDIKYLLRYRQDCLPVETEKRVGRSGQLLNNTMISWT